MQRLAYSRFFLRTRRSCGSAMLYTRRCHHGRHMMIRSMVEVDIEAWRHAVSTTARWRRYREGEGRRLCTMLDELSGLIAAALQRGATEARIRRVVGRFRIGEADSPGVDEAFERFIEGSRIRVRKGRRIGARTIGHYRLALRYLREYEARAGVLGFADLTKEFYHSYVTFLSSKGLTLNSMGVHIKVIKAMVRAQGTAERTQAEEFLRCPTLREETEATALSDEELAMIAAAPVTDAVLRQTRDLFLLMCHTGVRHSDLTQLCAGTIRTERGARFFRFSARKTGHPAMVKILPEAEEILSRYGEGASMPSIPSNDTFNRRLKRLMGLIAARNPESVLAAPFSRSFTRGGVRVTETVARWLTVRCHTARRTFATRMTLRGNPPEVICAATGHSSAASLARYVKDSLASRAGRLR